MDLLGGLRELGDPDRLIACLHEVNGQLTLGQSDIPLGPLIPALVDVLKHGFRNPEAALVAARSLNVLIDSEPRAVRVLLSSNGLNVITEKLLDFADFELAEQCLNLIWQITKQATKLPLGEAWPRRASQANKQMDFRRLDMAVNTRYSGTKEINNHGGTVADSDPLVQERREKSLLFQQQRQRSEIFKFLIRADCMRACLAVFDLFPTHMKAKAASAIAEMAQHVCDGTSDSKRRADTKYVLGALPALHICLDDSSNAPVLRSICTALGRLVQSYEACMRRDLEKGALSGLCKDSMWQPAMIRQIVTDKVASRLLGLVMEETDNLKHETGLLSLVTGALASSLRNCPERVVALARDGESLFSMLLFCLQEWRPTQSSHDIDSVSVSEANRKKRTLRNLRWIEQEIIQALEMIEAVVPALPNSDDIFSVARKITSENFSSDTILSISESSSSAALSAYPASSALQVRTAESEQPVDFQESMLSRENDTTHVWACPSCTFHNELGSASCTICGQVSPEVTRRVENARSVGSRTLETVLEEEARNSSDKLTIQQVWVNNPNIRDRCLTYLSKSLLQVVEDSVLLSSRIRALELFGAINLYASCDALHKRFFVVQNQDESTGYVATGYGAISFCLESDQPEELAFSAARVVLVDLARCPQDAIPLLGREGILALLRNQAGKVDSTVQGQASENQSSVHEVARLCLSELHKIHGFAMSHDFSQVCPVCDPPNARLDQLQSLCKVLVKLADVEAHRNERKHVHSGESSVQNLLLRILSRRGRERSRSGNESRFDRSQMGHDDAEASEESDHEYELASESNVPNDQSNSNTNSTNLSYRRSSHRSGSTTPRKRRSISQPTHVTTNSESQHSQVAKKRRFSPVHQHLMETCGLIFDGQDAHDSDIGVDDANDGGSDVSSFQEQNSLLQTKWRDAMLQVKRSTEGPEANTIYEMAYSGFVSALRKALVCSAGQAAFMEVLGYGKHMDNQDSRNNAEQGLISRLLMLLHARDRFSVRLLGGLDAIQRCSRFLIEPSPELSRFGDNQIRLVAETAFLSVVSSNGDKDENSRVDLKKSKLYESCQIFPNLPGNSDGWCTQDLAVEPLARVADLQTVLWHQLQRSIFSGHLQAEEVTLRHLTTAIVGRHRVYPGDLVRHGRDYKFDTLRAGLAVPKDKPGPVGVVLKTVAEWRTKSSIPKGTQSSGPSDCPGSGQGAVFVFWPDTRCGNWYRCGVEDAFDVEVVRPSVIDQKGGWRHLLGDGIRVDILVERVWKQSEVVAVYDLCDSSKLLRVAHYTEDTSKDTSSQIEWVLSSSPRLAPFGTFSDYSVNDGPEPPNAEELLFEDAKLIARLCPPLHWASLRVGMKVEIKDKSSEAEWKVVQIQALSLGQPSLSAAVIPGKGSFNYALVHDLVNHDEHANFWISENDFQVSAILSHASSYSSSSKCVKDRITSPYGFPLSALQTLWLVQKVSACTGDSHAKRKRASITLGSKVFIPVHFQGRTDFVLPATLLSINPNKMQHSAAKNRNPRPLTWPGTTHREKEHSSSRSTDLEANDVISNDRAQHTVEPRDRGTRSESSTQVVLSFDGTAHCLRGDILLSQLLCEIPSNMTELSISVVEEALSSVKSCNSVAKTLLHKSVTSWDWDQNESRVLLDKLQVYHEHVSNAKRPVSASTVSESNEVESIMSSTYSESRQHDERISSDPHNPVRKQTSSGSASIYANLENTDISSSRRHINSVLELLNSVGQRNDPAVSNALLGLHRSMQQRSAEGGTGSGPPEINTYGVVRVLGQPSEALLTGQYPPVRPPVWLSPTGMGRNMVNNSAAPLSSFLESPAAETRNRSIPFNQQETGLSLGAERTASGTSQGGSCVVAPFLRILAAFRVGGDDANPIFSDPVVLPAEKMLLESLELARRNLFKPVLPKTTQLQDWSIDLRLSYDVDPCVLPPKLLLSKVWKPGSVFALQGSLVVDDKDGSTISAESHFPSASIVGCWVSEGKWYFEVEVLRPGLAQIGWASLFFQPGDSRGVGCGDDLDSWAFDGSREKRWNLGSEDWGVQWKAGDVVGCAIHISGHPKRATMSFSMNGSWENPMGVAFCDELFAGPALRPVVTFNRSFRWRARTGGSTFAFKYGPPGTDFQPICNSILSESSAKEPRVEDVELHTFLHSSSANIEPEGKDRRENEYTTGESETRRASMESILALLTSIAEMRSEQRKDTPNIPGVNLHSQRLTQKIVMQIQDALSIASNSLPPWVWVLTRQYRFLIPFDARVLLFEICAFGVARALNRLSQVEGLTEGLAAQDSVNGSPRLGPRTSNLGGNSGEGSLQSESAQGGASQATVPYMLAQVPTVRSSSGATTATPGIEEEDDDDDDDDNYGDVLTDHVRQEAERVKEAISSVDFSLEPSQVRIPTSTNSSFRPPQTSTFSYPVKIFLSANDTTHTLVAVEAARRGLRRSSRLLANIENVNRRQIGDLRRQKAVVPRARVLEAAMFLVQHKSARRCVLSVEFSGETGHGLGPTLEFFSLVCRQIQRQDLELWRVDKESSGISETDSCMDIDTPLSKAKQPDASFKFVFSPQGLWPKYLPSSSSGSKPHHSENSFSEDTVHSPVHPVLSDMPLANSAPSSITSPFTTQISSFSQPSSSSTSSSSSSTTTANSASSSTNRLAASADLMAASFLDRPSFLETDDIRERALKLFEFLGRFIGKALQDRRLLDLPLSVPLCKLILGQTLEVSDVLEIDQRLGRSLLYLENLAKQYEQINGNGMFERSDGDETSAQSTNRTGNMKIESRDLQSLQALETAVEGLCLDFTFEGNELLPGGGEVNVTARNLREYLDLVRAKFLETDVRDSVDRIRFGLAEYVPLDSLNLFSALEFQSLLCGGSEKEPWRPEDIEHNIVCKHGFDQDSPQIKDLVSVLVGLGQEDRRLFMQFLTGSPRLPIGGFGELRPRLTVVRKAVDSGGNPDSFLPSCSTCQVYLKLPAYSSRQVLEQRLLQAMREGQGHFALD